MSKNDESLFRRLTHLFRSGPVVKRRVKNWKPSTTSSAFDVFRKSQSHVYSTAMSAYGAYDRMARYSDFSEMEYTPEISSALDIYSEEGVSPDETGSVLHIYSENAKIQSLLEELFLDTLNVEFNLSSWTRNLVKYGDFFLFNDVSPEFGIVNAYPIPVNEIEREEGFDPEDPMSVRFRWATQGNQILENWQISHFRLLGNDAFLPYGSSVLESARRIWRQLILIEDAMLVYRVIRSPERRVFKIDVGNVPPEDVPGYMEKVQTSLKRAQVVDKNTGRVDLRYNPLSVDEDYYLPVRGAESGTSIETLAGGANTTAIEDVEYIQKKLFAALKVPKAYLGYDEGLGAKATLSQEDIRFSRTINRIQRTIVSELNKLAIIHLYSNGYDGEDLLDFDLKLSNPSTIAQQQKLELYRTRFEIAGQAPEGLVDRKFIRKQIMGITDDEIDRIESGRLSDKKNDLNVESVTSESDEEQGVDSAPAADDDAAGLDDLEAGFERSDTDPELLKTEPVTNKDDDEQPLYSISDDDAPIKAQQSVNNAINSLPDIVKKRRRRRHGPDGRSFSVKPPNHDQGSSRDNSLKFPFGNKYDNPIRDLGKMSVLAEDPDSFMSEFIDKRSKEHNKMTGELRSTLKSLESKINISRKSVLTEENLDDLKTYDIELEE
jgi:hypothetical protein